MKKQTFWYYLRKSPNGYGSTELACLLGFTCLFPFYLYFKFPLAFLILLVVIVYIVLSILYPRVSNNTIYSRYHKTLNMNIRCIRRYWKIDYIKNRSEIDKLLKKEFIEGLQRLYIKIKPQKFTIKTHGWIYWSIMDSPEVQRFYVVKIIGGGHEQKPKSEKIIADTILSLMSWRSILSHKDEVKELSMRKRTAYVLELTPRIP